MLSISEKMKRYLKDATPYFILSLVAIIVFGNAAGNGFTYDDSVTIVNNSLIKSWSRFHALFSRNYFFLSGELSYRPIVTLTYFIDYSLWGQNPTAFHLTNIFLHTANTIVFYIFLRKVAAYTNRQGMATNQAIGGMPASSHHERDRGRVGPPQTFLPHTVAKRIAFVSALVFAVHPALTETVNSVSYREDLLAAGFFLIAFILFIKITRQACAGFHLYYAGSLCAYLLALFSKEMAITLPALLIVFNALYSSPDRPLQAVLKRVKGIYVGYFLITGFYLYVQFVHFQDAYTKLDQTRQPLPGMLKALAVYVKLLFLPFGLNADYVIPPIPGHAVSLIISAAVIITTVILTLRLWKRNAWYGLFTAWFFITLLPVSNIIPLGNAMAERYLYLPIMGFAGVAGMLVHEYTARKKLAMLGFGAMLGILGVLSIHRNGTWRDEYSLWRATSHREPNSIRAHHNLGVVYSDKGFFEQAEWEYKKTLKMHPGDAEAHYNLGNAYERRGMSDEAIREYQAALRRNPNHALAYNNIGIVLKKRRLFDEAIAHYQKAIQCNPFQAHFYDNLGLVYYEKKDYAAAGQEFQKALQINGNLASAHAHMGNVHKEMGRLDAALSECKTAVRLDPGNADLYNSVGVVYTNRDQLQEAIEAYTTAIRLNPNLANAYNNLGIAYAKGKEFDKAIAEMKKAVSLGFDNADVHNNLAGVYLSEGLTDNAIDELKLAIQFDPEDSNARCNLGNAYLSKGWWDAAVSELKEAVRINPDDAELHYYLGNALYRKGQYREAANALSRSLSYQPDNPPAHKMLGAIYANYLQNPSQAIFHLRETLRLDPGQPMAKEIATAIATLQK